MDGADNIWIEASQDVGIVFDACSFCLINNQSRIHIPFVYTRILT